MNNRMRLGQWFSDIPNKIYLVIDKTNKIVSRDLVKWFGSADGKNKRQDLT